MLFREMLPTRVKHHLRRFQIVLLQAYPEELLVASICLACVPGFVEYGMPPENTVFSRQEVKLKSRDTLIHTC